MHRLKASTGPFALVFVEREGNGSVVNGYPVLSETEFLSHNAIEKRFALGVGDGRRRQAILEKFEAAGIRPFEVSGPWATILDDCARGRAMVMCPYAVISSNVRIGVGLQVNFHSYVAHDCVLGDFVTLGPGAICNGNVHIGDHGYLGAGCVIRQGAPDRPLRIGTSAIVGMGAVVTRDVPDGTTVVGNPARPLSKG